MKIAWFANIDFEKGNAAYARILALAGEAQKAGHQITLYALSQPVSGSAAPTGTSRGISYRYLGGNTKRSPYFFQRFIRYLFASLAACALLWRTRKDTGVAILYNPRLLQFGMVYLSCKLFSVPVVIEKTEYEPAFEAQTILHRMIRLADRLDARLYRLFCAQLIVISNRLKQHYQQFYPASAITLIPILADLSRFEPKTEVTLTHTLGYLGSFGSKDNVKGILNAYRKAKESIPGLQIKFMGEDVLRTLDELLSDEEKSDPGMIRTGHLAFEDIPGQLRSCDVLILFRDNSAFAQFGMPSKLAEYLATGIPVICAQVGDIPIYLHHMKQVCFVVPEDTTQLASCITERYRHFKEWNEMGVRGRDAAEEHFNPVRYGAVLNSVLERAVNQRQHRPATFR